ncbi:MAG: hypothetical protein Q8L41_15855 [Anaerolineales bacterium]|nr:hypothetical protein [Anaerolineales bacterium]
MPSGLSSLLKLFVPAKYPADSATEPARITQTKVLLLVYDPVMDKTTGMKLSQKQKWFRPSDLVTACMSDMIEVSGGMARYQIVERVEVDEFPAKTDGFRYTPQTYMDVLRGTTSPHMPQEVNYQAVISKYNILKRVAGNVIDEVWIFGFPHAGFYESVMGGPGAFWCNALPLNNTSASKRRFVIMGFSYERQVGEMLEAYGHRAESIMYKTFSKLNGEANLWKRYMQYEKIAPGRAACGNIHFAPNSQVEYDWNNAAPVKSECHDWLLNFPNFKGDVRTVVSSEWGNGDTRAHHKWWFNHFPRVAGRKNGIHNNWWQYVAAPQQVII